MKYWFYASRPKTLAASAIPVMVGSAMAWQAGGFQFVPAVLALFFAVLSQVGANFANDWADARHGADTSERLGPKRAVASGWIAPRAMLIGTLLVLALASIFGLGLVYYGGVKLIFVGGICAFFAIAYSAGPCPLAYCGLGDLLVVLFFGIVAIGYTFFVQTGFWTAEIFMTGLAVGLVVDTILIANNYRDRDEDRKNRKYTLIALGGERFGWWFYGAVGLAAAGLFFWITIRLGNRGPSGAVLPIFWFCHHWRTWRRMGQIRQGTELVGILEASAKNLLLFGLLFILQLGFLPTS